MTSDDENDDNDDNDDNEETVTFDDNERVSQKQASLILGKDPRTIRRLMASGDLKTDSEGYLSRSDVKQFMSLGPQPTPKDTVVYELADSVRLANSHSEALVRLIEKPLMVALNTLTTLNQQLTERLKEQDKGYLDMMRAHGEVLMHTAERDAMREREAVKSGLLAQAGGQLADVLPQLMVQLASRKGDKGPAKSSPADDMMAAAKEFSASLTAEEKQVIVGAIEQLDGAKANVLLFMLEQIGIK